jgi:hypothetical protein
LVTTAANHIPIELSGITAANTMGWRAANRRYAVASRVECVGRGPNLGVDALALNGEIRRRESHLICLDLAAWPH